MKNKKNNFTKILTELIDETGVMERKKWAEYLYVTPSTISQWVNGKTYPRPNHLKLIIDILKVANKENSNYNLDKLYDLLDTPLIEILPEKEIEKLRGAFSLSMYLSKSYLSNFEYKLSTLPFRYLDDTLSIFERYIEDLNKELYLKKFEQIKTNLNTNNLNDEQLDCSENIKKSNLKTIEFELPKKKNENIRVKVAGIGGGGIDLLNYFDNIDNDWKDFFAIDTDEETLMSSKITNKILLSPKLNLGQGTGGSVEIAHKAILESVETLKKELLQDTKILFLITYLGKGIGSVGTPFIAKLAKDMGIFTVVTAITPSNLEGNLRKSISRYAISKLKQSSIPTFSYSVDYFQSLNSNNLKISQFKTLFNSYIYIDIKKILNFFEVLSLNANNINNFKNLLSSSGEINHKYGLGKGKNRGLMAVSEAFNDTKLSDNLLTKNDSAIIAIRCSELYECTFEEISQIINELRSLSESKIEISYLILFDNNLNKEIELTILIQKSYLNKNKFDFFNFYEANNLNKFASKEAYIKFMSENSPNDSDNMSDIILLNPTQSNNLLKINQRHSTNLD